jgi:DNA-binding transcriptional LysR family regulator
MYQLVLNGNGIALLPEYLVREKIEDQRFVEVLPEQKLKPIGVYAIWPPNLSKEGIAYRLIEHLRTFSEEE